MQAQRTERYFAVNSSIGSTSWIMDRTRPCTDGCEDEHHHHSCPKVVQVVPHTAAFRMVARWNACGERS